MLPKHNWHPMGINYDENNDDDDDDDCVFSKKNI